MTYRDEDDKGDNYVFLRGVLAAAPLTRTLPSGDELCSFRITVARPAGARTRVDSIDCSSTRAAVRRAVSLRQPGVTVTVSGSLRRRFWRSPAGTPTSRYEVDVVALQVQRRPRGTAPRATGRRNDA